MKLFKTNKYTHFLGVLALCMSTGAHAFNLSVLKNDKEARTHAYNRIELSTATHKVADISNQAFTVLGQTLNEMERTHQQCDLAFYQDFSKKLAAAGLPNSSKTILNLLIVWRSENLIDDIFFEIMEQTMSLVDSFDTTAIERVRSREVSQGEKLLKQKELSISDLAAYYEGFDGASLENPGCTVATWKRIGSRLAGFSKKANTVRLMNALARSKNVLSEDAFKLVEFYRINGVQDWNITLEKYLGLITQMKNKRLPKQFKDEEERASYEQPNVLSSKFKKVNNKKTDTTYRANLYYKYSEMQISMLTDIIQRTFDRMDATKTEVTFTFKNGSETLPVSAMGQYFLARKLLKKEIEDLAKSAFFSGVRVTHEDLVAAALETGLINAKVLDSTLKIDDLWNPEVPSWKKVANYAFRVTGTATIFLPPPYNVISSIAMVFIEGFVAKKTTKVSQGDNSYDFF